MHYDAEILNELAVELLGFEHPEKAIGERIVIGGKQRKVIGGIQNFHQESPRNDFEPQIFRLAERYHGYFSLKFEPSDYRELQHTVKQKYQAFFPGNPFDYFYLGDFYHNQYKREEQFGMDFCFACFCSIRSFSGYRCFTVE